LSAGSEAKLSGFDPLEFVDLTIDAMKAMEASAQNRISEAIRLPE
jgi:hypothetical protein